jgi:hypothetical protein
MAGQGQSPLFADGRALMNKNAKIFAKRSLLRFNFAQFFTLLLICAFFFTNLSVGLDYGPI